MKRPRTKVSRKTSSSASAAAAAQFFASIDDLLIQVFVRLPLKQLFRLKLVSKHWNSIISDPKLRLTLRNPEPAVGLIFRYSYKDHRFKYNPLKSYILYFNQPRITEPFCHHVAYKVLHSCNGLLLCQTHWGKPYIYNPITKKSSDIPGTGDFYKICGMYLAFDPSESCHYKIVCVVGLGDDWYISLRYDRFKFEVYWSETGSWRRCGEHFSATDVDFEEAGVYWKGAIHWLSLKKAGNSIYFNPAGDDDQMLPSVMPSPPIPEDFDRKRNYHFGESFGHLHFIDACRRVSQFNVYEMKNDYSEWFIKYRVYLSNFVVRGLFSVYTLVRGKKDDDTFLVLRVGKKFIRCNLVEQTRETIYEFGPKEKFEDLEFPHQYIEGAFG